MVHDFRNGEVLFLFLEKWCSRDGRYGEGLIFCWWKRVSVNQVWKSRPFKWLWKITIWGYLPPICGSGDVLSLVSPHYPPKSCLLIGKMMIKLWINRWPASAGWPGKLVNLMPYTIPVTNHQRGGAIKKRYTPTNIMKIHRYISYTHYKS